MLLDLHLPRVDGLEVLRWVRSTPRLSKLVVFVLSTSALRKDLDRALEMGADCYYVKPIDLTSLDHIARLMAVRWGMLYEVRKKR